MEFYVGAKRYQPGDYRLVCVSMILPKAQSRSTSALRVIEDCELWDIDRDEMLGFVVSPSRN